MIRTQTVTITTVGGAGVAVGSGTTEQIEGFLLGIYLDFNAAAPNTTDTTLECGTPAHGTILVVSNSNTDGFYAPRQSAVDATAAATGQYEMRPVKGTLTVSLAGCDALTAAVVATIYYLTTGESA